ncbi:SDR family oxidoreductase [Phyllobacterium sp. 21LDTY02-6]|uniref:SDR family NAD(P)-dependent oxidoreductase n=1 Tax=unclassified Phyllobacterium TaxID=2638441 RepID=UPI00202187BD|nr:MULTISPECIES: SDR family NAD(P)-dependent oxidoreductase [unclassified Phyllobacterium]MCO4317163.1 SDR family oxidoreductase [Phyllobacterium sp. 21LDTY02-6]MCX8278728.1 SDR family NAD(P)-dependent oxidoreductase [Phyllobacterium sp. 0TCS1.6C]MCX8293442.1 SDR family NAD(P)-dependent oxidoreductase [Phyllobacterium sp. 0TCS1.6A]
MANIIRRYEGRHAVITGGASGIGFRTAERIISEGGTVTLWDVDAGKIDAARQALGPSAHGISLDVSSPEQVEKAAKETEAAFGKVDVLVCSAGITGPNAKLADYPIEEWKRVFDINLNGLFYCNRFIVPIMQRNGYGRIVNVASIAGKEGNPNASAYSASKAAVIGLTKSLGKELVADGITVNAITPATVDTPILQQLKPEFIDYMLSKIPMQRFGKVDELASLISWIASEECSFTTGAVFDISGGRATY